MVAFVVEHGEGDNEEHKHGVENVNGEPQVLHRERELTRAVVDSVPARLPVRHVSGEHEDGDCGNGEPQNDDEFGEVGLVLVVGVLVVHKKVHVHEEHDHAHHDRHDHQSQVEIPHFLANLFLSLSLSRESSFFLFLGTDSEEIGEFEI